MVKKIALILILPVCILLFTGYFLLNTTPGNELVIKFGLSRYGGFDEDRFKMAGNLNGGITLKDIVIDHLKGLPEGSELKIQKLFVQLTSIDLHGLVVEIENAKLQLPDSDPVILMGTLKGKELDLDIYSRGFSVNEIRGYLPDLKGLIPLEGEVNDVDLYVKGRYDEPKVTGTFNVEKFIYKGFVLRNSPWDVELTLKDPDKDIKLFGRAKINGGTFQTKKVSVQMGEGYIDFDGAWNEPQFQLNGTTTIEKTKIVIGLKGTMAAPELTLSSTPSYSRQKLMVMLATGKSWQSVENAMETGVVSSDLTKDFIDYFFFAGRANAFAGRFGVQEFTVTLGSKEKGIRARKNLTENLAVGYAYEQKSAENKESVTSQKVQGEFQVTTGVSLGVENEVIKEKNTAVLDETSDRINTDKKVFLKYEKSF